MAKLRPDDSVQDQPDRDQHRWNERPRRVLHRFRARAGEQLQWGALRRRDAECDRQHEIGGAEQVPGGDRRGIAPAPML